LDNTLDDIVATLPIIETLDKERCGIGHKAGRAAA